MFDRQAAGYKLSHAGVYLVPFAETVAAGAAAFAQRAELNRRRRRQIVRITTSDVLANLIVTPAIADFTAAHPDVLIHTIIDDRRLDLMKGEADLALRVGSPLEDGELVARKLAEAAWGLYCSRAYLEGRRSPSSPEELEGHVVLGFEGVLDEAPASRWLDKHAALATPGGRSNNLVNHLNAIKVGIGIGALPRIEGDRHEDLHSCLPFMEGAAQSIWLVMRPEARTLAGVRAFADRIVEKVTTLRGAFSGT